MIHATFSNDHFLLVLDYWFLLINLHQIPLIKCLTHLKIIKFFIDYVFKRNFVQLGLTFTKFHRFNWIIKIMLVHFFLCLFEHHFYLFVESSVLHFDGARIFKGFYRFIVCHMLYFKIK